MYVAIYARHSTNMQGSSTTDQLNRCQKFCEKQGYQVAEIYCDEGVSGSHLINRHGVSQMLSDALDNRFQGIITEDLSRLSRDQEDVAGFFKRMSFIGIWIETVTEGMINELHIGLKGTMNALYLKDLADKTKRGMIASVLKGRIPGGEIYGYDVVHKLDAEGERIRGLRKINEEQAETVKWIFQQYSEGKTLRQICDLLNFKNISAPNGKTWHPTALCGTASRQAGILRNTTYKGILTFNKMSYKKHPDSGKRRAIVNPRNEWIAVPCPELSLIDDTLFDEVQKQLKERSSQRKEIFITNKILSEKEKLEEIYQKNREWRAKQSKSTKPRKIFSGKIFCGLHGEKIKASRGNKYACSTRGCPARQLTTETIIIAIVENGLKTTEEYFAEAYNQPEIIAQRKKLELARDTKKAEIADLSQKVTNTIEGLGPNTKRTDQIREYFELKELEIRRLKLYLTRIERDLRRVTLPADLPGLLDQYHQKLKILQVDPLDPDTHRLLRSAFLRVELTAHTNEAGLGYLAHVDLDILHLVRRLSEKTTRQTRK